MTDRSYPAMIRLRRNAWTEFVPFLDYDVEIRKILCSTNAIKSEHPLPHGHAGAGSFPDALKALYLAVRSLNLKDTAQFRAPYSSWLSDPGNTRGTHIGDVIGSDTAVLMVVHEAGQGLFDEFPQRKA